MTTQIVATRLNGDLPAAMLETTALTAIALLGFAWCNGSRGAGRSRRSGRARPPARGDREPDRAQPGRARRLAARVFLLLPHATLLLISFVPVNT